MIRFAFAILSLSILAPAQGMLVGGNGDERLACSRFLLDDTQGYKLLGSFCIQYGQPTWKAEYAEMADQAKGQSLRLGKNYWTTLNNSAPLQIGATTVPAGAWYLGLRCDEEGKFHLLVLDAKNADAKAWTPFNPTEWKADHTCALEHAKSEEVVEKLTISVEGKTADALELKIAWGGHVLNAPVKIKPVAGKASASEASKGKAGSAGADKR